MSTMSRTLARPTGACWLNRAALDLKAPADRLDRKALPAPPEPLALPARKVRKVLLVSPGQPDRKAPPELTATRCGTEPRCPPPVLALTATFISILPAVACTDRRPPGLGPPPA